MLTFPEPPKEYGSVYLEDTDAPLPGTLNHNTRYIHLGIIAKGGKSVISRVKDRHLNRLVAHKMLRPEFTDDPIENTRLLREARVSAMLQHPYTIPTYEIGRDSRGRLYFTMKLVHGFTLREVMEYRERYDLRQLMEVMEQVARALAYAHDHGVAHRDIKPENILIGPYGEVLILDWGLAKVWHKDGSPEENDVAEGELMDEVPATPEARRRPLRGEEKTITGRGKLQGTLLYMSPEQIQRDPNIGFSTDIYSVGSVMYELLTGQPPFEGTQVYEILDRVKNDPPKSPSEVSALPVPSSLEELCMHCLEKKPDDRPASMDEVLLSLQGDWDAELLGGRRRGRR
ncbi:MAG: serine/threonine-protein kinase [Myxococcota bacterium]